jgi:protein CpxP
MDRLKDIVTGTVVAALLASGVAFAQGPRGGGRGPGGPGGPGGGPGGPGLELRGLNLTDAQEQQVRDIRQQEREGLQALQQKVRAAAEAQRAAIELIPVNEGLIRETTAALAELEAEVAIRRAYVHNQVWAVLTPAQQAQATKIRAERAARQKERAQNQQERRRG